MRAPEPHVFTRRAKAVEGALYNLYEITYTTKEERGYGAIHAPKQLTIAAISTNGGWADDPITGLQATIEKLTGLSF